MRLFLTTLLSREADLPAQRPAPQAQARLPGSDGHSGRAGDPEAPSRQGSQAPLGLGAQQRRVQRRHRLSRSRDFDAVYRHGRSVSTRYLVLYRFDRESPDGTARLGIAVPKSVGSAVVRNRIKRQLRETWCSRPPEGSRDYVLVVKPGLPEAAEARGFEWLRGRVDEVLGKAAA